MKRVLTLLIIIFLSISVRSEYNGYYITLSIENVKGEFIKGYVYTTSSRLNMDSLNNSKYVINVLERISKEWNMNTSDSLLYFKEKIKYEYQILTDSLREKTPIYTLNNRQTVSIQEVKSIKITEMIDYTYLTRISNPLSISDTVWLKTEPLNSYSFFGYLCEHHIYIHKNSKKIDAIINKLKTKQNRVKNDEINDKTDMEYWKIIEELYGENVVIVTTCTC